MPHFKSQMNMATSESLKLVFVQIWQFDLQVNIFVLLRYISGSIGKSLLFYISTAAMTSLNQLFTCYWYTRTVWKWRATIRDAIEAMTDGEDKTSLSRDMSWQTVLLTMTA